MPEGVEVDVEDGVATVVFTDTKLRGHGVQALLDAVGPENVQTVTIPRKGYVVPEDAARKAGLLDEKFKFDQPADPKGYDDGKPDMDWSRKDIDAYAEKAGVEDPEKLGNKQEVLDAIKDAEKAAATT